MDHRQLGAALAAVCVAVLAAVGEPLFPEVPRNLALTLMALAVFGIAGGLLMLASSERAPTPNMPLPDVVQCITGATNLNPGDDGGVGLELLVRALAEIREKAINDEIQAWAKGPQDPLYLEVAEHAPRSRVTVDEWKRFDFDFVAFVANNKGMFEDAHANTRADFWFDRRQVTRAWPQPVWRRFPRIRLSFEKRT